MTKLYYEIKSAYRIEQIPLDPSQLEDRTAIGWPRAIEELRPKSTFVLDTEVGTTSSLAMAIQPRYAGWEVISSPYFAILRRRTRPYRIVWVEPVTDERGHLLGVQGRNPTPGDIIMVALILSDDIVGSPQELAPLFLERGLSAVWNHFRTTMDKCAVQMRPYDPDDVGDD